MISLRYHIVSITAVFLALAVGIVLGSTTVSQNLLSGLSSDNGDLEEQVTALRSERDTLHGKLGQLDQFAHSIAPLAARGKLDGNTVILVTTVDARPQDRDALAGLLRQAGAKINGELQLTESFTNPQKADQIRDLVMRLQPSGAQLPTGADPGTRAGGLVGALLLTGKDGQRRASDAETAAGLAGLVEAGFIKTGEGIQPAQLAIVLTGGRVDADSPADRAATIARLATQLDRSGAGVVLAGRQGSAEGTGSVGAVRADTSATAVLSTIDNIDTAQGQLSAVLALREQRDGGVGRYGFAGNAEASSPNTTS